MKKEIIQKINGEIINKVVGGLYAFAYSDEEPGADVLIVRIEKTVVSLEFNMDFQKNEDGIISSCGISVAREQKNRIKDEGN